MSTQSSLLMIFLCVAILVPVFLTSVPECNAQQTVDLTVTHEEVGWTNDMLALSPPTTTPEIGLSFQVTIYNNDELPLKVGYQNDNQYPPTTIFLNTLTINFEVIGTNTPREYSDSKQIVYNSQNPLYLLPKESIKTSIVAFDDYANYPTNKLQIGDYTAKITYQTDYFTQENAVEKYPFNFAVASDAQLQKAIQDNKANSGTTINIGPFNLTLFDFGLSIGGSVVSVAVVAYLLKRWKKGK